MLKNNLYVEFDLRQPQIGALVGEFFDSCRQIKPTPLTFNGRVAKNFEDFGSQYQKLHRDSIVLGDQLALWNARQLERMDRFKPTEKQRELLGYLFGEARSGNVCDNAVDYNDIGRLPIRKGYSRAAIITRPAGFKFHKEIGWEALLGESSEITYLHLPRTGYVRLTDDGAYHPTGFPFDTAQTREEAEKSWIERGFEPEFARHSVSYFWSRGEDRGVAVIVRGFWSEDHGSFDLSAVGYPDSGYDYVGRLKTATNQANKTA